MRIINNGTQFYGEKVRIITAVMKRESPDEFPEVLKWKRQALYFHQGEWIEICRIDNYPHENRPGSHIHQYEKKDVLHVSLSLGEAKARIEQITKRILLEKFNEVLYVE